MKYTDEQIERAAAEFVAAFVEHGQTQEDAMRAALATLEPPEPEGKFVTVRAAVSMSDDGRFWTVKGMDHSTDELMKESVLEYNGLEECLAAFITARVPLPQVPTITAEVEG